ncbi:MAG: glutamine-hydrolyzing GMP synthase [Clostridiales bacterium]|jgi:GMP synthase (glutamine-hydrolysing)|nr:glutamine-hydrolyzing GMP synthase [Clostridiales bacterium]
MAHDMILVLDFGGQYNQLIVRRIRDLGVYSEIMPYDTTIEQIESKAPKGIILTGGPRIVTDPDAPLPDRGIFELSIPILGICYGCQLMGHMLGGLVTASQSREYGKTELTISKNHKLINDDFLFAGLPTETICWMSHTYFVSELPPDFEVIAKTASCPIAGMANNTKKFYGVQFHPEVVHTIYGNTILDNFIKRICKAKADWKMENFTDDTIRSLREQIGDKSVLCALSGGVDSSVAAVMIHKAVGKQLTCIFVDNGLLRLNEADEVEDLFKGKFDMNVIRVDAHERFLSKLKGVTEPEEKRKIIGTEFIRVFEEEAKKIGEPEFLAQGTIYPDIVESGNKHAAVIKSHHNVGGLPKNISFKSIIEPLRDLFKDEVRRTGVALGMTENMVYRQPFPGPGLAVRCLGEVNIEKLSILRKADHIFREEIAAAGLEREIWQYFAVLPDLRSVGVMGDERTYCHTIALRAVTSLDAMTADWAAIPYNVLKTISNRIVNEVSQVNRVVYDITSKPPATIEWE